MGTVATIDAASNAYEFQQVLKACREDQQVMTVEQKIAFFYNKPGILAKAGRFMSDFLQATK